VLTGLVLRFGYGVIFVAAAIEGDAALISGAFLARRGYFSLPIVTLVAALGTIAGNQVYYWIGRRSSASSRLPAARLLDKAGAWLTGRGIWIAFVSRFVYGLRVAIPVACGITRMPPVRFSIIDGAGALLWAAIVGTFGAVIGHVLELLIEDIHRYEGHVVALAATIGVVLLLWFRPDRRARQLIETRPDATKPPAC
jgi:membrane protein DedA with SNARE-associated domain